MIHARLRAAAGNSALDYPGTVLSHGPVAYLRLDDASGSSTADDATANNNDGTATNVTFGGAALVAGGGSAFFDASALPEIAIDPLAAIDGDEISVGIVGRHDTFSDALGNQKALFAIYADTNNRVQFKLVDGKPFIFAKIAGSSFSDSSTTVLSTGTVYQYHVVFGTTWDVYVNGVNELSFTPSSTLSQMAAGRGFFIGRNFGAGNQAMEGDLAECAVYDYLLTTTQITQQDDAR